MFGETIERAAQRYGDRVALHEESGATITYAQLHRRSDDAAAHLVGAGVREGSIVALTIGSGIDYLVTYAAAAKLGAVTAGINPSLTDHERRALLDILEPDAVIDTPLDWATSDVAIARPAPHPDRTVAIVFTSGTTGLPKGAVFANRQLEAIAQLDLGETWQDTSGPESHMLVSTQFAHVGFMTKLPWYLAAGMTLHCLDRWSADKVLTLIDRYKITTLGVVAPQLALMLRHPLCATLDLSSVTTIIAGGAASSPSLVSDAVERFEAAYSVRYSSTESGGIGLGTAFDAPIEETLETVGRPRPGVEVKIIDDSGEPVQDGEIGELCLRTPSAARGYWRNPEASDATFVEGWIRTGDLASIDTTGCVRIAGRAKEMYIRGGYNVAPGEVEAVLCNHDLVTDIAIAVRPDPVMGEVGVAVVVAAEPRPSLEELRTYGAQRLARWKLPEAIIYVDAIPLTPMQKIDRVALNALAASPETDCE